MVKNSLTIAFHMLIIKYLAIILSHMLTFATPYYTSIKLAVIVLYRPTRYVVFILGVHHITSVIILFRLMHQTTPSFNI